MDGPFLVVMTNLHPYSNVNLHQGGEAMSKYGLLVISHGSRDPIWVQLVRAACAQIQLPAKLSDIPIECAFLELVEGHLIQDGIDRLETAGVTDIIVIPLFISSGSTHIDEISWALGLQAKPSLPTDLLRFCIRAVIHWCPPIDDDPEIARLLVDKLKPVSHDPTKQLVLLVGHGSREKGFYTRWHQGMASLAAQMKELGGYAEADIAMLLPNQAACKMKLWQRKRPDLMLSWLRCF